MAKRYFSMPVVLQISFLPLKSSLFLKDLDSNGCLGIACLEILKKILIQTEKSRGKRSP